MNDWKQYLEDGEARKHKARKINKEVLCKKNKLGGGRFGHHKYDETNEVCTLCGHINKAQKSKIDYETFVKNQEFLKQQKKEV